MISFKLKFQFHLNNSYSSATFLFAINGVSNNMAVQDTLILKGGMEALPREIPVADELNNPSLMKWPTFLKLIITLFILSKAFFLKYEQNI